MILRSLMRHVRDQNWFAVALEFVIVIVSVVIAFQVTAWDAARGERELEKRYISRLAESVLTDIAEFRDAESLAAERGEQAPRILAAVGGDEQALADPDAFLRSIITAGYTYTPNVDRVAFDEMISRGHIGIIRNEPVRSQIAAYYQRLETYSQWDYMRAHVQTRYMTLRAGVLTPAQERLWSGTSAPGKFSADEARRAAELIAARPELIGWLPTVETWQQFNEDTFHKAAVRAEDLLDALRTERERLQ